MNLDHLNRLTSLIFLLMTCAVHASETVRSRSSQGRESQSSTSSKNNTAPDFENQINKVGNCPKTLVDSVNDDRKTKMLGAFSKVEKSCGNYTLDAPGQIAMNMRYSTTPELYKSNLESMLAKKVSPQLKYQLEGCRQLPPEMQAAIATRLYSASLRFDDFNTRIAEQIAYIDNLVPENDTNDYECSELFINAKNRCPKNYRNVCKAKSEDRLTELAKETASTLAKMNTAKNLLESCKNKNFAAVIRYAEKEKQKYFGKKCGAELKLIQFLESKNSWLTSPKFLKSVTSKPSVCTGGNQARGTVGPKSCTDPVLKSEKEIMRAIKKDLSEDRKALIEAHKKSIKDFKCMYSNKVNNSDCNFNDIRKTLVEIGDSGHVKLSSGAGYEENVKKIELEQYLGIEKCTLELGQDRQIASDEITDAAGHAAVDVALTFTGVGAVAVASRLISKAGRAAKIVQKAAAVTATMGADIYYGAQSVRDVIKECKNKKFSESKISIGSDQAQSTTDYRLKVCNDPKSLSVQIKDIEDGCLESALWAAVDTMAIGVGAKGLANRTKGLPAKTEIADAPVSNEKIKDLNSEAPVQETQKKRTTFSPAELKLAAQKISEEEGLSPAQLKKRMQEITPDEVRSAYIAQKNKAEIFPAEADIKKIDQRNSIGLSNMLYDISRKDDISKLNSPESAVFLKKYKNDPQFAEWLKNQEIDEYAHNDVSYHSKTLMEKYDALEKKPEVRIKNVTLDLSDTALQERSKLGDWQSENGIYSKAASKEQNALASLRKGDSVVALSAQSNKKQTIEIGEYLGAGNTSNVYSTADSTKVVRLPFETKIMNSKDKTAMFKAYLETRSSYEGIDGLNVVKVHDHGKNYEYIVTDKVPIKATMDDILVEYSQLSEKKNLSTEERSKKKSYQALVKKFDKIAEKIAIRSDEVRRIEAFKTDRSKALIEEGRQVAVTPDGELILLDWEGKGIKARKNAP